MAGNTRAYTGNEPYIFLCYAHQDTEVVAAEIATLRNLGLNVWYDEGLHPGERWSDELAQRITGASHFVFMATPRSVVSRNCIDEIEYALDREIAFLAIHVDPIELPQGLRLRIGSHQALERADPGYREKLANALGGDEQAAPTSASATSFWTPPSGCSHATVNPCT